MGRSFSPFRVLRRVTRPVLGSRTGRRALFVAGFFLPLLGWLAWTWLGPHYHHYRAAGYNTVAFRHLGSGKNAEARIALQNSFRHEAGNAETWRLYGWVLDAEQSPDAPTALLRALQLQPDNARIATDGLRAATRRRQFPVGQRFAETLTRITNDAALWNAAGLFWQVSGDNARARDALDRAVALKPDSADFAFNRSVARLLSPLTELHAEAVADVTRFAADARFREPALAALATSSARTNQAEASALWDNLAANLADPWQAQVQALLAAHAAHPDGTPHRLHDLLTRATNTLQRSDVITLAARTAGRDVMLTLFESLPSVDQAHPATFEAWANTQLTLRDWPRLEERCAELLSATQSDASRLPLWLWQWRAQVERLPRPDAKPLLDKAQQLAARYPAFTLPAGLQLAVWGFPEEAAAFYGLGAVDGSPVQRQCLLLLLDQANRTRRLADVGSLSERLLKFEPDNPTFLNNATYAQLVRDPANPDALERALDTGRRFPQVAAAQATAAWSQFLTGRTAEAVEAFETLGRSGALSPQIRLRMAEVFLATGHTNHVPALLQSLPDSALFPEEQRALARLRTGSPAPQ